MNDYLRAEGEEAVSSDSVTGKPHAEVSRALQHRRATTELERLQSDNRSKGRVHVPDWWFEMDAYGAAVEGIVVSIQHALASGSIGLGQEQSILCDLIDYLKEKDPDIQLSDELIKLMEAVE